MKTVEELTQILLKVDSYSKACDELRAWALEIIDEVAANAEFTMEETDDDSVESYELFNGKLVYPVLIRESINRIKEQL